MHTDRYTKAVLTACALGLWANVALNLFPTRPAQAQPQPPAPMEKIQDVNIVAIDGQPITAGAMPVQGARAGRPIQTQNIPLR